MTRGFQGMPVPPPDILGHPLAQAWEFYYLCLAVLVLVVLGAVNLTRSPTGRAMVAIRDSEISAQSLGVNLVRYKTIAFALSAFITGLAGALLGHKLKFISPDAFNILLSIQLLLMVVVGGPGLDPRRHLRRHLRRRPAAGHRPDARLPARRRSPGRRAWSPGCSAWS